MNSGAIGKQKGDIQVRRIMTVIDLLRANVRSESVIKPRSTMSMAEREEHSYDEGRLVKLSSWKCGFQKEVVDPWRAGVAPIMRIMLDDDVSEKSLVVSSFPPISPLWPSNGVRAVCSGESLHPRCAA